MSRSASDRREHLKAKARAREQRLTRRQARRDARDAARLLRLSHIRSNRKTAR